MNAVIEFLLGIVKKSFEYIVKFFKWMFSSWKNVLIILFAALAVFLYFNYRSVKHDLDNVVIERNDSLKVYRNKVGELYAERETYITDNKHLKESNSELYAELKKLKDNPIIITKVETVTEIKEIYIKDSTQVIGPDQYKSNFSYADKWCNISGYSILDTKLLTNETFFNAISFPNIITLDLIESKKKGEISFVAKSDNPYCQINNLNGVVLSPESSKALQKRFDKKWVVVAGIGATVTVVDNNVKVLPGLQITFGRKLFAF